MFVNSVIDVRCSGPFSCLGVWKNLEKNYIFCGAENFVEVSQISVGQVIAITDNFADDTVSSGTQNANIVVG